MEVSEYQDMALSYGAGVNSTALAILLVKNGWRGDIVFADTGAEYPETYDYLKTFERWLEDYGLSLTTLRGLPYQRYRGGITLVQACEESNMVPLRYPRWCTVEYKVKPCRRWLNDQEKTNGFLLGISADESWRSVNAVRPLTDELITRDGCRAIIHTEGLPIPMKSRCWICPMQTEVEWRHLFGNHPKLYQKAQELERASGRELDSHGKTLIERRHQFEREIEMSFGREA